MHRGRYSVKEILIAQRLGCCSFDKDLDSEKGEKGGHDLSKFQTLLQACMSQSSRASVLDYVHLRHCNI